MLAFRDVTRERLHAIADNIPNGMVYQINRAVDGSIRFTYVSKAVERLHGLSAEAVLDDPEILDAQVLEDYRPKLDAMRRSSVQWPEVSIEFPMRVACGDVRWFQRTAASRPLPDGSTVWDGVEIDVTERRKAEAALRESEARLKLAIDAGRMAVWEWDAATQSIKASPELNRMLGFPADHPLTLEEGESRYLPGEGDRIRAAAQEALARGERFFEVEYQALGPGDAPRWFLLRAELVLAADGTAERVIGVLLDITDRRHAEEALREREAQLSNALGAASLATFEFDFLTRALRVSPRMSEIYDYPADHALSIRDLRARHHPEDLAKLDAQLASAIDPAQRHFEVELRLLLPDGRVRWVNSRGEWVRDPLGRVVRSRGVVQDITGRKSAEEHRMLLTNELNHRVKNTLATVQSLVNQTLRNAGAAAPIQRDIESRLMALSRAHDVLTRESWEGADLADLVAEAIGPYQGTGPSRFLIDGPSLLLEPRVVLALAMAFQELATNALKYGALSTPDGRVAIRWSVEKTGTGRQLVLRWAETGGPKVRSPGRRGFGSRLIERSLAYQLDAKVSLRFEESGVVCTIRAPL